MTNFITPNSKGFFPSGSIKEGRGGKTQRFLAARRYASAGLCDSNVSVRLSVTSQYCVKTKKKASVNSG